MMIISPEAIINELKMHKDKLTYYQTANLCILLANHFLGQAHEALWYPDYIIDASELTPEQRQTYQEIFTSVKELTIKLNTLSKTSTRYVQDH